MEFLPFQVLLFPLLSALAVGASFANATTQVSTLEAQLPTEVETPTPNQVEGPAPNVAPSIAPMPNTSDFNQPWQEREEEIQQQNQEEETQTNEEYNSTPENVEEPGITPTPDENPY